MNETKVNLTITLPGSVMFSKEECLKTTQKVIEKKNKRTGKTYKKVIEVKVDDPDKVNHHSMKVVDKEGLNPEIITFSTRKCKPATQVLNISTEAYKAMIDKNSCPSWIKPFQWAGMSKKSRLEAHMQRLMENFGGTSYNYQVFED